MIYKIEKTNQKNEFLVNEVVLIKLLENNQKYSIDNIQDANKVLTNKEADSLANELKTALNLQKYMHLF